MISFDDLKDELMKDPEFAKAYNSIDDEELLSWDLNVLGRKVHLTSTQVQSWWGQLLCRIFPEL